MKKIFVLIIVVTIAVMIPLVMTAQQVRFDYSGSWYYEGIGDQKTDEGASAVFLEISKVKDGTWQVIEYKKNNEISDVVISWGFATQSTEGYLVWIKEFPLYGETVNIVQNNAYIRNKLFIDDGFLGFTGQFAPAEKLPKWARKPLVLPKASISKKDISARSMTITSLPGMEYSLEKGAGISVPMHMEVVDISGTRITLEVLGSKLHFTFIGLSYTHLSKFSIGQLLEKGTELARMLNAGKILMLVTDIVDGRRVFVNPQTLQYKAGDFRFAYVVTYADGTKVQGEWQEIKAY